MLCFGGKESILPLKGKRRPVKRDKVKDIELLGRLRKE